MVVGSGLPGETCENGCRSMYGLGDEPLMLNRADEYRQRADECRRNAAQAADDVLRGTYLDLARRWRMMANQAEPLEQKEETKKQAGWL
jgi:hypothetical protein